VKFEKILNKHFTYLSEQTPGENDATAPLPPLDGGDAALPDLTGNTPNPAEKEQATIAPEGYVDLVRLLVKATAMNFPAGSLDELYRTDVTKESALTVQKAVEVALKQYETHGDNQERLDNPNLKNFANSITPKNFIEKLKKLKEIIKQQDPYIS